jgi:hypothetical protein
VSKTPDYKSYYDAAKQNFSDLQEKIMSTDGDVDFWKTANAFDTMIDFLSIEDPQSSAKDVAENVTSLWTIGEGEDKGKDYYRGEALGPGQWFDDYGWWVVATNRAAEMPFFADKKDEFRKITKACWARFKDNAPHVWERRTVDTYKECEPAVAHNKFIAAYGVWNSYWTDTDPKWVGPRGDPTDRNEPYQGVQNTVTNALYLIAAQRLGDSDADQEFNFLNEWFDMGTVNSSDPPVRLFWDLDLKAPVKPPPSAVIRERVSFYVNRVPDRRFDPNWVWTGDQGLILSALVDRAAKMELGKERTALLERAEKLLNGAYYFLTDSGNGGVLRHWRPHDPVSNHVDDYSTGTGVFWRNMLHVWNVWNGNMKPPDTDQFPELNLLNDSTYRAFIKANAEEATSPLPLKDKKIFNLTNNVAVLVAAIKMKVLG